MVKRDPATYRSRVRHACAILLGLIAAADPVSALVCPPAPLDTCRVAASTRLILRHDPTDPSRSLVKWRWTSGQASLRAAFGEPTTTTASAWCLYDEGGLIAQVDVGAGGQCDGDPCWSASGTGFRFAARGVTGGVRKVLLRADSGDRAKAMLRGAGAALPDVALPLAGTVVAQWLNDANRVCLEGRFASSTIERNDGERFSAAAGVVLPPAPLPRPSAACGAPVVAYATGSNNRALDHDGLTRSFGV